MTYTLEVTYYAGNTNKHEGLDFEQATTGLMAYARAASLENSVIKVSLYNSEAFAPCKAFIRHGPGHQSTSRCEIRGPHEQHAIDSRDFYWSGDEGCSGYFDESPEEPE